MYKIFKYVSIMLTLLCGFMIYVHWNDHEVSAWVIAFTGWIDQAIDRVFNKKEDLI